MAHGISEDIQQLRREYHSQPFEESHLPDNPFLLFRQWFEQAREARILEPNAMSLATVSPDGHPGSRTVLLKAYDEDGFIFFTNYESEKARHIAANPHVAALFPWLLLSRQVEITGRAEKIPATQSLAYFLKRPFKSRVGAWISAQSSVIPSRKILEAKFEEMCRKFASGDVPLPSAWGGYRIIPKTIEFWQGGAHRLHDRFRYQRDAGTGTWQIQRLAP